MTGAARAAGDIPPLALTMGEPAGIGGELTLKAWLRHRRDLPAFFVIDDPDRLGRLAHRLGWEVPLRAVEGPETVSGLYAEALPVLPCRLAGEVAAGRPDAAHATAVRQSIETAVALVAGGRAAAVVTNPIHKETLYAAGFRFPGHTEFLADLAGTGDRPVMMLTGGDLRVVPVTIHVSLAEAARSLSRDDIVAVAAITAAALRADFGIERPRLAVAGLNPHAGEAGSMGREDIDIVAPAVAALRERGIDAFGPLAADTLFHAEARRRYDAAICMYHDQALIPVKTLAFERAVNVTLGLPFVRTSPDHGTAFDIAGSGTAGETSLVAALQLAARMAEQRRLAKAG